MESKYDIFIFTIHLQPMGQITNILIRFWCIQQHVSSCKKKHRHRILALRKKDFQVTKYIERSTIISYKIL